MLAFSLGLELARVDPEYASALWDALKLSADLEDDAVFAEAVGLLSELAPVISR